MNNLTLSNLVIFWYKKNYRHLPWRPKKVSKKIDPYLVLVSEFMLQQTTVKTVIPYFDRFINEFPKMSDLAKANIDDILTIWSGLGYYRRANYLLQSSKIISREFDNKIPHDYKKLIKFPGIGDYTAAAISAIAFDKRTIVVDGNIERVLSRIFIIKKRGLPLKKEIKNILIKNIPNKNNSFFVQGLMDIGATICMPKIVKCSLCPLENLCCSAHKKESLKFPLKINKKKKETKFGDFYCFINKKNEILFLKNETNGLFENMFVLPSKGWQKIDYFIDLNFFSIIQKINCGTVKHSFTHFDLKANVFIYIIKNTDLKTRFNYDFFDLNKLSFKGIPKLYFKIIENALAKI